MAIATLAKGYSGVTWLLVRSWSVALLAGYLSMQARKRIACKRMVKLGGADHFPVAVIVTLQTVGPETSLMLVLMAGGAGRGNSQKGSA